MGKAGTTALFHDQFSAVVTSPVFSSLNNYSAENNQAFRGFNAVQSSSSFTSLNKSGYAYFPTSAPNTTVSVLDALAVNDSVSVIQTQVVNVLDALSIYDSASASGPIANNDILSIGENFVIKINISVLDTLPLTDIPSASSIVEIAVLDALSVYDSLANPVGVNILDAAPVSDVFKLYAELDVLESIPVYDNPNVRRTVTSKSTVAIQVRHQYAAAKFSTAIIVQHYFPAAVNIPYTAGVGGTFTYPYTPSAGSSIPAPTSNPFD